MDTNAITLLAEYNEKTNKDMNKLISQLNESQWEHAFKTFFPSIHTICNHIYISDFNWLKRFGNLRDFEYMKDSIFSENIGFTMDVFKTQKEYLPKREYLDKVIIGFGNEITETDLKSNLKYSDSRGLENSRNFGGLVLHMFNHQTHHRGMISVYLEEMGIENDYSNLARLV